MNQTNWTISSNYFKVPNTVSPYKLIQIFSKLDMQIPDDIAAIHLSKEISTGRFDQRSYRYFRECWGWGHNKVKKFIDDFLESLNQNRTTNVPQTYQNRTTNEPPLLLDLNNLQEESDQNRTKIVPEANHKRTKSEPNNKREINTLSIDPPEEINSRAWREYLSYRKEKIKKPFKTERGIRAAWRKLSPYSYDVQAKIIQLSIDEEWTGLFPEHIVGKQKPFEQARKPEPKPWETGIVI